MNKERIPMTWSVSLIEWESLGLDDIPTANLICLFQELKAELEKRKQNDNNSL